MYDQGIIDDTFGFEVSLDRSFYFADFSGDAEYPEEMLQAVEEILLNYENDPEMNEKNLELLKKKMLGKYFQSLNSLEFIANQFTQSLFGETTLFDLPDVIRSITLNDVRSAAKVFIDQKAFSRFYLLPTKTN